MNTAQLRFLSAGALCALAFFPAVPLSLAAAEAPAMRPYEIDPQADVDSPADVSFLLEAPAGEDGFIQARDGHLYTAGGKRFRIWGVNLTGWGKGSTNLPPKEEAARCARTLARLGINCVRFHFLDMQTHELAGEAEREASRQKGFAAGQRNPVRPAGLIESASEDTQHMNAEAFDRLDYFVAELKKLGIYSNLNLNVGRSYKAGDGVPDYELIHVAKGVTYFGDRLVELQRDYARRLLTHYNPYTKSEYRNEPAVATVEIVNENSLFEFWFRNWLRGELRADGPKHQLDLTLFYERQLTRLYNEWLDGHLAPGLLASLREEAGVAPGAPMPRLRRGDFGTASKVRFSAEAEFYASLEEGFLVGMKTFLKKELGVRCPVVGSADHTYWIPNLPLLLANSKMDQVDAHVYWQHPAIWGARNTAMVDDPLHSTVVKLARSAMEGHPFTVSEVNHPNPNEYAAEMIPILAAYAAFQDWDGVYFYTYEPKVGDGWDRYVCDEFDLSLDPVKISQMGAGALLFSRADVSPARENLSRSYTRAQVVESMRQPEAERPYFTPGFPKSLPLRHGSRIRSLDAEKPLMPAGTDAPPFVSDTGELAWLLRPDGHGVVTIDTPRTQGLVGYVAGADIATRHLAAELKNEFCALTLSSLSKTPIARADRLLLTACSRWQNTGSRWNSRRTLWEEWGRGPTLIEPVSGWLMLRELDGAVAVSLIPLDGASRPIGKPIPGRRMENGWEVPLGEPATARYLVEVAR